MSDDNNKPRQTWSVELEVGQINVGRPHVVILGAGASRAATPNGDLNGNQLPVMDDLVKLLELETVLSKHGFNYQGENFESLYSQLVQDKSKLELVAEIEEVVYDYFKWLQLPSEPTIYDYLMLGLREKDVIVTFNWDPFLIQAYIRNKQHAPMPQFRFLHGNVAMAYCEDHKAIGSPNTSCPKCGERLQPTKLLYPVEQKDYNSDAFISREWEATQYFVNNAFMLTVFGYGAPQTDVEAIALLKEAWTTHKSRELLETEVIDIKSKEEIEKNWEDFFFSHHYLTTDSFFESWLFKHPRRSCEAMWNVTMEAMFVGDNKMPTGVSLPELQNWVKELVQVEAAAKSSNESQA